MARLLVFLVLAMLLGNPSIAQQDTYITEYYRLLFVDRDSARFFCDELLLSQNPDKEAFGFAGKAYVAALEADFEKADLLFVQANDAVQALESPNKVELRSYVQLYEALRLIESHELEAAIDILSKVSEACRDGCSEGLNLKVQSTLGRSYSMSSQPLEALRISQNTLSSIRNLLNANASQDMQVRYAHGLLNAAGRAFNYFLLNKNEHRTYVDTTIFFTENARLFVEKNQLKDLNGRILLQYADINLHTDDFAGAKENYVEALGFYKNSKYKKRVEQISFQLAECHYNLNEYQQAEDILVRQLEESVWEEYQLLDYDARLHYYLFKIYEVIGLAEEALQFANSYQEKMVAYYETKRESDLKVNNLFHSENRASEIKAYVDDYNKEIDRKRLYAGFSGLLIFTFAFTVNHFVRQNKRKIKNIQELNGRIEELQLAVNKPRSTGASSLTDANAEVLLGKLKILEQEELYLRPDYSLNLVAKNLNTNTSYLSKTVNNYMGISFAEYSNRLKVNGIVNKLQKHRRYRNYTIDALANEAGYKSVNAFNTNFKKILKVTPSQYLKELAKEQGLK